MNLELAKALGEIERGAERHLRARREQLKHVQQEMGNKQAAAAHTEETEDTEIEEVTPETHTKQSESTKAAEAKKTTEQDDTTMTEEDNPTGPQQKRKTQSIAALNKTLAEAKIKEQQHQWDEATKWRCATDAALGDVDLETDGKGGRSGNHHGHYGRREDSSVNDNDNCWKYKNSSDNGNGLLIDTSGGRRGVC